MSKLAVFFPGIGYTVDRPLLYYSRRMAAGLGYEIRLVTYTDFPKNALHDSEKMTECYRIALAQATRALSDIDWDSYEDILFVGKSIGTGIAAWIAAKNPARSRIRLVLYTPLEETFTFSLDRAVVFTGTNDPWVDGADSRIPAVCEERGLPCVVIRGGNHSLETGDMEEDLQNMQTIMRETKLFICKGA